MTLLEPSRPETRPPSRPDPALPHRFTWEEVEALVASGALGEARAELIEGEVFLMPEEGFLHVDCVRVLQRWLLANLAPLGLEVCIREPVHLPDGSVTIPDLSVFPAGTTAREMRADRAELLIEVADATERRDRDLKLPRYAAAGVGEVWLVSAPARAVTRHRAPIDGAWSFVQRHGPGEAIAPHCAPDRAFDPAALPSAE